MNAAIGTASASAIMASVIRFAGPVEASSAPRARLQHRLAAAPRP